MGGLCGTSDMRDCMAKIDEGCPLAREALDIYVYRLQKYIGSYIAALGRVDALVFTGGVGENQPAVVDLVCEPLGHMGVGGDIEVMVVPTNEELSIARETCATIESAAAGVPGIPA